MPRGLHCDRKQNPDLPPKSFSAGILDGKEVQAVGWTGLNPEMLGARVPARAVVGEPFFLNKTSRHAHLRAGRPAVPVFKAWEWDLPE